jgi:hypothetical protein
MKLSDFQEQYHWMNGLSEYFKFNGQEERWEYIHKALYHDNWYRKRDVMIDLASMPNSNPSHVRAWMNVLLHEKLEDVELKPQMLATLFRKYMREDPFLVNICQFVNYWAKGDHAAAIPDMNDFLSRGQVKSKLWLISELVKIVDGPIGNIAFYGGWYNFLAHMMFHQFDVNKIYSIDLDDSVVVPSKRLYPEEVAADRFIPVTTDVSKLQWRDKGLWFQDHDKRSEQIEEWMTKQEEALTEKRQSIIDQWLQKQESALTLKRQPLIDKFIDENQENIKQGIVNKEEVINKISEDLRTEMFKDKEEVINKISEDLRTEMFKDKEAVFENYGWRTLAEEINMVINTSCEHMDNTWFENLPSGTFVVLHQNDYFENEQHSNCCKDLEEVKSKYPMQSIFYEGELDTHLYNRFMLIGIK